MWRWKIWLAAALLVPAAVWAQQQQKPQEIPDAPSASRPPQPFPANLPPSAPPADTQQETPEADKNPANPEPAAPPMPEIKTVPPGGANTADNSSREELYKLSVNVNFVVVPVTVKDRNTGRMVNGLLPKDFSVFEDGVKQKLTYLSVDPFPISAAVIFDMGMPDEAVQKINQTYPALEGAFSQYDQVALYTYSNTVTRLTGFSAVNSLLTAQLRQLKGERGRNNGPPVMSGPLATSGPVINGVPVTGGGTVPVTTPPKEAHVLNDAILKAAIDLAKQDRGRRKIIFVISDGREFGSTASYADTLKLLLTNGISIYGVATDTSALPGYKQLSKLHIPRFGYDNLLPKYAYGTGGEVFTEFSQQAIEAAYASAAGEARNQYTLGYQARPAQSSIYRDIEVRVDVPNLNVRAKTGYYPLPPGR